jgi:hypothetical protein
MARLPLLPRVTIHLLTVFTVIAFLLIVLFPTLSYARSVYRPNEDSATVVAVPPSDPTESPSLVLKFQQADDSYGYNDAFETPIMRAIDPPGRVTTWMAFTATMRVAWHGLVYSAYLLLYTFRPLHIVTVYVLNKLFFITQPFIILITGVYTIFIVWPTQFIRYITSTLYPLYVFLACASIIGLLVGGLGRVTASFINNRLFPHPPPDRVKKITPRPRTSESIPESVVSSGAVTPLPLRAPPPSKYHSGMSGIDEIPPHVLDTNALFSSFSLPAPPATPPGILYSAPTPAGSVSGVVGETIFEEEDDSDDRTPVASVESFAIGGGRPLSRPESAHSRPGEYKDSLGRTGTWHGRIKREDVDAQVVDWRNEGMRKRNVAI